MEEEAQVKLMNTEQRGRAGAMCMSASCASEQRVTFTARRQTARASRRDHSLKPIAGKNNCSVLFKINYTRSTGYCDVYAFLAPRHAAPCENVGTRALHRRKAAASRSKRRPSPRDNSGTGTSRVLPRPVDAARNNSSVYLQDTGLQTPKKVMKGISCPEYDQ